MRTALINTLAYALMVLINYLANALPFNGQTTGEVSAKLDVLFTPAGYVFGIWGLIYLLLGIWIVRQWLRGEQSELLTRFITPLFVASCLLNSVWIVLWHYEYFLLTVIVMIALLVTLIMIYRKVWSTNSRLDKVTFSIYLGWISVATIANISYYLVFIGWGQLGLPATVWTVIMLLVATGLAAIFILRYHDRIFALVFVWAFIGIGMKQYQDNNIVAFTAFIMALLIVGLIGYSLQNGRHEGK